MDHFEEDLTCSICLSIFEDPRVLPCSHTFCRSCLENIIYELGNFSILRTPQFSLKCPTCRSIVDLPPIGTGSLPTNFSLMGIIEKYQKEKQLKNSNCLEHKQPLNMFCLLDRTLVCGYCLTVGQHQRHSVVDLQNAYVKEKEKASKLVDHLTDKGWEELSNFIEKLEQQKLQADQILQDDKQRVIQYFEELQKTVEMKKRALLATFGDVKLKLANEYDPLIQKMRELKEEHHNLLTLSTCIKEEEEPLIFLEKFHTFRQRMSVLMKTQLPVIHPLDIHPQAERFLTGKWSKVRVGHINEAPILQAKHFLETHRSKHFTTFLKEAKRFSRRFMIILVFLSLLFFLTLISLGILFKGYYFDNLNARFFNFPQLNMLNDIIIELDASIHLLKSTVQDSIKLLVDFFAHLTNFPYMQ
ncbi:tripartite motif-containing protein 59 [Narcine bancroftii]|uniref:tripartite motif-containing protein 59 n=1 Tax=Narcine bancroftii TaxID=1343680 RepID=UPI0038311412